MLCLPIGKLLRLGNLDAQNDGRHFLDALIPDAVLPHYVLQVYETLGRKAVEFLQPPYIVQRGGPYFQYAGIGQDSCQ